MAGGVGLAAPLSRPPPHGAIQPAAAGVRDTRSLMLMPSPMHARRRTLQPGGHLQTSLPRRRQLERTNPEPAVHLLARHLPTDWPCGRRKPRRPKRRDEVRGHLHPTLRLCKC